MLRGGRGFTAWGISPAASTLVAAVLSIAVLAWAGVRASRAATAHASDLRRMESTLHDFAELRRSYQPAVAAESIAWRRTLMDLRPLGVVGDERLALTQAVSRTAEDAGLQDVRVTIGPSDTTGPAKRLSSEGIGRKPASFSLLVECRGGLPAVLTFLGQLPPATAATQLSLVRADAHSRHRISLAVYELTTSNGPPQALWSPVERGAPGDGRGDRPGG